MNLNTSIRNIGIIAHVDHGKTTLVDQLLRCSGTFRDNEHVDERVMDSMDLEKEKGITIKSKNASITWNETVINIADTPGHADFGGEIERILKMVDGVLLLVDAAEGPQAQTKFVLRKAIANDLRFIVVINKIDREFSEPQRVHDEVLELLLDLDATEDQFNAPFLYCSAKDGYATRDIEHKSCDMRPLFETVIEYIPPPVADAGGPFQMLVSNLDWDDYVGRIAIGKILKGTANAGDAILCIHKKGAPQKGNVRKLLSFNGLGTSESASGESGDIIGIAAFDEVHIGYTFCDVDAPDPEPFVELDPPTLQMQFRVNDGPLAGRDGKFVTARHIRE